MAASMITMTTPMAAFAPTLPMSNAAALRHPSSSPSSSLSSTLPFASRRALVSVPVLCVRRHPHPAVTGGTAASFVDWRRRSVPHGRLQSDHYEYSEDQDTMNCASSANPSHQQPASATPVRPGEANELQQPHAQLSNSQQHVQSSVSDDGVPPPFLYPHTTHAVEPTTTASTGTSSAIEESSSTTPMASSVLGHLLRRSTRIAGLSAAALVAAWTAMPLSGRLMGRVSDVSNIGVTGQNHPHLIVSGSSDDQVSDSAQSSSSSSRPLWSPAGAALAAAKYSKKTLSEKLAQVPVFAVTNASGQPYLANMDGSGSQVGLIFFSHDDALKMLTDMQKNPSASDARVYIMGLDKAYEMVKARPTPSGIRSSSGEELTMVFRFFPDSRQVKAAEVLSRGARPKLRARGDGGGVVDGVPVFVAKGLTVRKGKENVVPLFLNKEDLDAAWEKLRQANKDLPQNAHVVVGNLLYIIQQMEKGETPELQNMGFFAPRASVEYVAREQAGPTGQARMHQNPVAPQK